MSVRGHRLPRGPGRLRRLVRGCCIWTVIGLAPAFVSAQAPLTLRAAVERASVDGGDISRARIDTVSSAALVLGARSWPNPQLITGYTQDVPRYHVALEFPLDPTFLRRLRIGAAAAGHLASRRQWQSTLALTRWQVESAYARARLEEARASLSRATWQATDTLLTMTRLRRDEGDASDLDVDVAMVEAIQFASMYSADSLQAELAVLEVQRLVGLGSDQRRVILVDSLATLVRDALATDTSSRSGGLPAAAARATVDARALEVRLARRRWWPVPSVTVGFDTHDPSGTGNTPLPMVGVSVPLPTFTRFGAGVQLAQAAEARARVDLAVLERETEGSFVQARQTLKSAEARLVALRGSLDASRRIAERALLAYREGAAALPYVLQVQRSVRDAMVQLIGAEATALSAAAQIRYLLTPTPP